MYSGTAQTNTSALGLFQQNNALSTADVLKVINEGTGDSFIVRTASSELFSIDDDGSVYMSYNGTSNVHIGYGIGGANYPNLNIYGRNAANTVNGYLQMYWGDGTNDDGFIKTSSGDLVLDAVGNVQLESDLDVNLKEVKNVVIDKLSSDPGSPTEGQIWYNTTSHQLKLYNGTSVVVLG